MAGTAWNVFAAGTVGFASKVNENFDWIEGDIVPQNAGVKRDLLYKLGDNTTRWRSAYISNGLVFAFGSTISSVDNSTIELSGGAFRLKAGGVRGSTANSGGSAREISQGTISTPDLRATSVINATSSGSGSLTTGTTITAVALTTEGNPIWVVGSCNLVPTGTNPGADTDVILSINRNNLALGTVTGISGGELRASELDIGIASGAGKSMRISFIDTPAAGNYKYEMRYTLNSGFSIAVRAWQLFMMELKR